MMTHYNNPYTHSHAAYGIDTIKNMNFNLSSRDMYRIMEMAKYLNKGKIWFPYSKDILQNKKLPIEVQYALLIVLLAYAQKLKNANHHYNYKKMIIYQFLKQSDLPNKDNIIKVLSLNLQQQIDEKLQSLYNSKAYRNFILESKKYIYEDTIQKFLSDNDYLIQHTKLPLLMIYLQYDKNPLTLIKNEDTFKFTYGFLNSLTKLEKLMDYYKSSGLIDALKRKDYKKVAEIYNSMPDNIKSYQQGIVSLYDKFISKFLITLMYFYSKKSINKWPSQLLLLMLMVADTHLITKGNKIFIDNKTPYLYFCSRYGKNPLFIQKYMPQMLKEFKSLKFTDAFDFLTKIMLAEMKILFTSLSEDEIKEIIESQKGNWYNQLNKDYPPNLFRQYIDYLVCNNIDLYRKRVWHHLSYIRDVNPDIKPQALFTIKLFSSRDYLHT